jgi:hypothetical protein
MATVWTAVAAMNCVLVSWMKWHTAFEPWIRENSSYGIRILTVHKHLFNCIERVRAGAMVEIRAQSLASVAKFPREMVSENYSPVLVQMEKAVPSLNNERREHKMEMHLHGECAQVSRRWGKEERSVDVCHDTIKTNHLSGT